MFALHALKSRASLLIRPIKSQNLSQTFRHFSKQSFQKFSVKNSRTVAGLALAGVCLGGAKIFLDSEISTAECKSYENQDLKKKCYIKGMKMSLNDAVHQARDLVHRVKDEVGAPGIVVGVSIDGETVWEEGFGYSDIENRLPCTPETVMRIASISKSMTMVAVAKLWEEGKLDLDVPVQTYVPTFPEKTFDGEKVVISPRHLVSHTSGIRHYDKNPKVKNKDDEKNRDKNTKNEAKTKDTNKKCEDKSTEDEFALKEYYIKDEYDSVTASLDIFKDDPLIYKPGTKFLYTTHGYTLLSAVVEGASKVPFSKYMIQLFHQFGLRHTYLDKNEPLIYNRSRNYIKKRSRLVNAPYVDNSYKWAGGGFLSTVGDLLKFGNIMLYSYHYDSPYCNQETNSKFENNELKSDEAQQTEDTISTEPKVPGYLKPTTVKMMWTPIVKIDSPNKRKSVHYGMGWVVIPEKYENGCCEHQQYYVTHSGGAVGASSQLLILPRDKTNEKIPSGIVVTLITNLVEVKLESTALAIAKLFERVED